MKPKKKRTTISAIEKMARSGFIANSSNILGGGGGGWFYFSFCSDQGCRHDHLNCPISMKVRSGLNTNSSLTRRQRLDVR